MISAILATAVIGQGFTYTVAPTGSILGQEAVSLAGAPTGTRFVAGMFDNSVRIYDAKTRQTLHTFRGHNMPARAVAFSPKGDKVASGSENAQIRVWDIKSGNSFLLTGHQRAINALYFNQAGTRLVSTSDDDTAMVWDLVARKSIMTIPGRGNNIYGVRYDRTGQRIVAGSLANGMVIYNATGQAVRSYGAHEGAGVNDVDINGGFTRGVTAGRDSNVGVWDLTKNQRISYLRGHTDWVYRVSLAPNGQVLASSSTDGTVRVWDINALRQVHTLQRQQPMGSSLAWVADGNLLVTIGEDNFIRIYSVSRKRG